MSLRSRALVLYTGAVFPVVFFFLLVPCLAVEVFLCLFFLGRNPVEWPPCEFRSVVSWRFAPAPP